MLAATIRISAQTLKKVRNSYFHLSQPYIIPFLADLRIVGFRLVWSVVLTYSRYIVFHVGFLRLFDTHIHYKRYCSVYLCYSQSSRRTLHYSNKVCNIIVNWTDNQVSQLNFPGS